MTITDIEAPVTFLPDGLNVTIATSFAELEPFASQIVEGAKQPHIQEFEYEDSWPRGRFASVEDIDTWMDTPRTVYFMSKMATGQQAAIVWFSPRPYGYMHGEAHHFNNTFGIRIFEGFEGRGLSQPLMRFTHDTQRIIDPDMHGVWLSAKPENERAVRAYEKFGYIRHKTADGLLYMTLDIENIK